MELSELNPGETIVELKRNAAFIGKVLSIAPNGTVFLKVISWAGEVGGWGVKGVLSHTSYHISELEVAELGDRYD